MSIKDSKVTRRAFVTSAALGAAAMTAGLAGCASGGSSSSDDAAADDAAADEAAAPAADAGSFGDPIGFPTPVKEREKAVWKVDFYNDADDGNLRDNPLGLWGGHGTHYRTTEDEWVEEHFEEMGYDELGLNKDVSREGMDTLKAMGGMDFTAKMFDWILGQAKEIWGYDPEKLTVFDLRGESHGLVNGDVFMYWCSNNCVNESMTTAEVLKIEKEGLDELRAAAEKDGFVEIYKTDDNWSAWTDEEMDKYENPEILSEEELVTSKGANYVRFATTNHFRPDDGVVDEFIDYVKGMDEDGCIYMHCYAGEGRTTCFMVMYDMLKCYKVASCDDICARQGLIGPVDVRTEAWTTKKSHYKMKASVERRIFLQLFYKYLQETDAATPWTDWARDNLVSLMYYPPAK